MNKLAVKNLSKSYQLDKNKYFHALSNINLSFKQTGMVGIIGKSGSGKSTLINMIARIDTPTKGEIFIDGRRYTNKKKDDYKFYREQVGIIFQNYQLLEDKSVIYNVALPLLTCGVRKKKAYAQARLMLDFVNIKPDQSEQLCRTLSGGEKQRVAIARAIANNQSIILCDEPTGALDTNNSKDVMELLKELSKTRLVIVVSHNLQLIDKYVDRKIELRDGKVINDIKINALESEADKPKRIKGGKAHWTTQFSLSNFKRRFKRNAFVILALSISLIMGNLVFGFMYGKDSAIESATYRQFDYGYGLISKEETVSNTGLLKLTKSVRPTFEEIQKIENLNILFEICPNFSTVMPLNPIIQYDGLNLENLIYTPVYSFDLDHYDESLIIDGPPPLSNSLEEVVINYKCRDTLKAIMHKNPLGETINVSHRFECNYVLENGEYITDVFTFNVNCKIVAVCDELSYLASNKIYYSYLALENYMQESVLQNLSTYYDSKITWYDRVMNAEDYSYISAYSYQLFLKNYHDRKIINKMESFGDDLTYSSNSIIVANSLVNFLQVAEYALFLFLGITLIGAILILSIISFTNFSEDRKVSAILTTIGARDSEIEDIYLNESIISGFISLVISIGLSIPLAALANKLIFKYVSISNIVQIPLLKFFNVPFLYPIILTLGVLLIIAFATIIPIKFSQSKSIKQELQAND